MSRSTLCLLCSLVGACGFSPTPPMWVDSLDSNGDGDYTLVDLQANFNLFDMDRNGKLTPDEFMAFCGLTFGMENGLGQMPEAARNALCSRVHAAVQKAAGSTNITFEGWVQAFLSCPASTVQPFIAGVRKEIAEKGL